jgi:hypothetical protein
MCNNCYSPCPCPVPPVFSHYSNVLGTEAAPKIPRQNEFVPLNTTDTADWTINPLDNTQLVCQNPGTWNIISQYQIVYRDTGLPDEESTISGWFNLNGEDVAATDAAQSCSQVNPKSVLAIALVLNFQKGDIVRFGVRGSSASAKIQGFLDDTGVYAPSLIVTATRTGSGY